MKLNSHGRTIVCPSRTIWTCATTCWNQCTTSWVNARCFERIWRHHSGSIHIIKVPNPGVERRNKENVRYLPHTAVIRQNRETTKLRIVYDGSAKSLGQGRSLNDCLPVGPNYIPHPADVLASFRWHRVAISEDEKALLMIRIQESHRDMLRFLWPKDPFVLNSEVLHLQFCRLVFGLRPLPSILRATITYQLDSYKKRYSESVKLIKDSLYVDDLLADASDVQEGFESYQQSKELIARVPLTCANGIWTQLVCFNSSITKRNLWCNRRQRNQVNQLKRKMNPLQSPLLVQIKCL